MSRALGTKPAWIGKFVRALLRSADANVIAVDWVYGASGVYYSAVENVVKLGIEISRFLSKLLVGVEKPRVIFGCLWRGEGSKGKKRHMRGSVKVEAEPPQWLAGLWFRSQLCHFQC